MPNDLSDVGAALTGLLQEMASSRGAAANFVPQQVADAGGQFANVGLEQRGGPIPALTGNVSVPVAGGELGVKGSFHKPDMRSPAELEARLGYTRRF